MRGISTASAVFPLEEPTEDGTDRENSYDRI
jgi:hypothetical protein